MAELKYDELCNLIALQVGRGASPNSVDRYLTAMYKVILQQLKLNKKIRFKNFGCFEIKNRKSGERLINDPNTQTKTLRYVKDRFLISFKPSEVFDKSVNDNGFKIITNKGINRLPKDKMNTADLLNRAFDRKE